jgi:uncharacterized coiled-coil protein SlyX
MAGVDFDRKAFVPAAEPAPRPQAGAIGSLLLVLALAALAFFGYKLLADSRQSAAAASDSQNLDAVQQQLTRIEKRLDQLERRRKSSVQESDVPPPTSTAKAAVAKSAPTKTLYTFIPPNGAKAMSIPHNDQPTQPSRDSSVASPPIQSANEAATADREAWQATTDRLADVVGVVGSQEGEISQTREQLNALLARTRRSAVQFELHRGSAPQSVGPVSMMLKGSDPRSQRYTVCVYLEDKCVELKDRTVDEVVVFVVSRNSTPLGLVATRILRDRIVGYLEVPDEKPKP